MAIVAAIGAAAGYWVATLQYAKRADRAIANLDALRKTIARERLLRRLGQPEVSK